MTPAEFFRTLYFHRRFVLTSAFAVAVVSAAISLVLPSWYAGRATLLPPEDDQGSLGLMGAMLAQTPIRARFAQTGTPSEIFVRILESRTVMQRVVEENGLVEKWDVRNELEAVSMLSERTAFSVTPEGLVRLRVMDREPERAAQLANSFIDVLDEFNREMRVTRARRTRVFIEQRLEETRRELEAAEETLRGYEEESSTVELSEQTRAAIGTASDLLSQIVEREVRLGVLSEDLSDTHPRIVQLRKESEGLRAQLNRILATSAAADSSALYVPFAQLPAIKMETLRQARELKILNTMYALLVEQYEQARIQEERDQQTVQVLDRAVPPLRREKPQRTFITLAAGLLGFFFAGLLAFAADGGRRSAALPTTGPSPSISQEITALRRFLRDALGTNPDPPAPGRP